MKMLLIVVALVSVSFGQTHVIHRGDIFKADQDYNLFTDSAMTVIIKDKMALRTLQQKEVEFKYQITSKEERIKLLNDNISFYKEISDKYRKLWVDAEDLLVKKSPRKWYENKLLWYSSGLVSGLGLVYMSSVVLNNISE